MSFEDEPKTKTTELPDDELSQFAQRMAEIYAFLRTKGDQLNDLYATDENAFQDAIEDLTDQVIDDNPVYRALILKLKKIRQDRHDDKPTVKQINDMRLKIRQVIISEAGLPDESRFSQIEHARSVVADKVKAGLGDEPLADPYQALSILGITKVDDDKTTYTFPYDLMPESVVDKWKTYLATVCKHVQLAKNVAETGDQRSVEEADRARKFAHNSVTDDVNAILGLEGIDGWSRLKTRDLLGKIRDDEIYRMEAGAGMQTEMLVHTKSREINVVTALAQH